MASDSQVPVSSSTVSTLDASYNGPTASKTFAHTLPSAPASTESTQQKTQYLSALRKSVVQLQDEVNEFLTSKMVEDRVLAAGLEGKVDEKKEEDMYGEEDAEAEG